MAKIDSFLEMMVQRKVNRAVMAGGKPFVLVIGGQQTEGSLTPATQLQHIITEIAPERLQKLLSPESQQDSAFNFSYMCAHGEFNIAIRRFALDLEATITPAQTEHILSGAAGRPIAISPQLEQASEARFVQGNSMAVRESAHSASDIICPNCQARNRAIAAFCTSCGQAIPKSPKTNFTTLEFADGNGTRVEILQYNTLSGSDDISLARSLFYAQQVGVRLKQVKIILNGGAIVAEAGALHFMKGHVTCESSVGGVEGFAKKLASNMLTKETMFKPRYTGRGEVHLEPTFGHYILTHLNNEEMIVDKGMFYASEASIAVGVAAQKNISSALFGGEGFFQTRLSGTGWCVLSCPVPSEELLRYQLHNERLCVDGNFALLRKGQIDFTVERSAKSFLGSLTSGEGVLQTFTGTGEVWIAPTQSVYAQMKHKGVQIAAQTKGSSGSNV